MTNDMTYSESAKGILIDAKRARQEIERHGADWDEFVSDPYGWDQYRKVTAPTYMGQPAHDRVRFDARDILTWLGY